MHVASQSTRVRHEKWTFTRKWLSHHESCHLLIVVQLVVLPVVVFRAISLIDSVRAMYVNVTTTNHDT